MKTIKERAKEAIPDAFDPDEILPAREGYLISLERRGFIKGAQSEHTELTQWHSECETPECSKSVLIKCKSGHTGKVFYVVGYHSGYEWCDEGVLITHYDSVIGWREIHEQ